MTQVLDTLSAIRTRRTIKAISDTPLPVTPADSEFIDTLLEAAYWAPYHYPCSAEHQSEALTSEVPWRFYVLDSQTCRDLCVKLTATGADLGKLGQMLNTAEYLIVSTWLPQPHDSNELFEPSVVNMEHIAAASSAVQNLLLAATALGRENYWGSGGIIRQQSSFELLGIPTAEVLLGTLFIFPSEANAPESVKFRAGARRDKRGEIEASSRWITL